jgi:hypothetical protein
MALSSDVWVAVAALAADRGAVVAALARVHKEARALPRSERVWEAVLRGIYGGSLPAALTPIKSFRQEADAAS